MSYVWYILNLRIQVFLCDLVILDCTLPFPREVHYIVVVVVAAVVVVVVVVVILSIKIEAIVIYFLCMFTHIPLFEHKTFLVCKKICNWPTYIFGSNGVLDYVCIANSSRQFQC